MGEAFAAWATPNEVTTWEDTPCKVAVRHLGGGPKEWGTLNVRKAMEPVTVVAASRAEFLSDFHADCSA